MRNPYVIIKRDSIAGTCRAIFSPRVTCYFSGQSSAKTSEKVNLPLKFFKSGLQTAMLPRIGWTYPVLLKSNHDTDLVAFVAEP
jgi:hypothetical protein